MPYIESKHLTQPVPSTGAGGVRTGSKGIDSSKSIIIDGYGYGGAGGPNSKGCSGVRGGDGRVRVVIFYS